MSRTVSASTNRRYGVVRVAAEWNLPRSSLYARRARAARATVLRKRGPKSTWTDEQLLQAIRADLAATPFVGEGHRKVWARLRVAGIRTSKQRVLRLMREHHLLAPTRALRVLGPQNHEGTITSDRPDDMWGTDLTTTMTVEDGQVAVFIAVDHCTAECVGIHAAVEANRFEALEPVRQAVKARFGAYGAYAARGLKLRHDHGIHAVLLRRRGR
ncbi:MAG TPA: transposase [Gammaproteobacteria bacterium]|nr:transposase [Gammaproteobacteria bacterium]